MNCRGGWRKSLYCLSVDLNDVDWHRRAACKGGSDGLFFDHTRQAAALKICARCEVRQVCLQWRMDTLEPWEKDYGVWGGTTPRDRALLRLKEND